MATPKARSAKPGMTETMSRPLRTATVTFHSPARSAFCSDASTARSARRLGKAPLLAQSLLQPPKIARRLVHVGLGDLDVVEADDRIDLDRMAFGALADDLPMDLAFGRHVDDEIAANPGLAAEPPARRKRPALRGVAALDRAPWRHMIGARMNRVLGEIALARHRPDSGRKCRARRRPNRDRRQARARPRAGSRRRQNRLACRTA